MCVIATGAVTSSKGPSGSVLVATASAHWPPSDTLAKFHHCTGQARESYDLFTGLLYATITSVQFPNGERTSDGLDTVPRSGPAGIGSTSARSSCQLPCDTVGMARDVSMIPWHARVWLGAN